jgi:hypothetical protein
MSRKRRTHSPDFKAKVALAAIKGDDSQSVAVVLFSTLFLFKGKTDPCSLKQS